MTQERNYNDLKVLFFACSLRDAAAEASQDIPYRHKLKQLMGNFTTLYNREITPQLFGMYNAGENSHNFDIISAMLDDFCAEFSRVRPDQYPVVIGLLKAFNEGALFQQLEVKEGEDE